MSAARFHLDMRCAMKFDFETMPLRTDASLKERITDMEVKKAGYVSFGPAELDYATAPSVIESIEHMVKNGLYGFTLESKRYLDSVKWWMKSARNWDIDTKWIVPVRGTIHAVATAIRMTTAPGEGIIVMSPGYNRYGQAAHRLHRVVSVSKMKCSGMYYEPDFADLECRMADGNNRLLVLCNPNNPTGRVWRMDELCEIARLSNKYGVYVISDEIFAEITFGNHKTIPYSSIDIGRRNAIVITSLGKTFNFTGVNHANCIIPDSTLRENYISQRDADHYGSLEPFAEAAILGAYTQDGLDWVNAMKSYVSGNANLVQEFFSAHPNYGMVSPVEGTYVAWIRWADFIGEEPAKFLLERALVQLEPGDDYGPNLNRYTRMNLGAQHGQTRAALERANEAIKAVLEVRNAG